jgi:hypothetical protein
VRRRDFITLGVQISDNLLSLADEVIE